jgi:steroid 5-alpha reductase family enzyme
LRARSFRIVAAAYAVAALVAVITAWQLPDRSALEVAFWADIAATVAIFAASRLYDNSSFYDAYWSVAPIPLAVYWAVGTDVASVPVARQLLVIGLVSAWGLRLTYNWGRGWKGLSHEDWRYVDKREQTGVLYWPVSFLGLHMMPTLLVFAGCLPLWPALSQGTAPLGLMDLVAAVVTAGAIAIETVADEQLRAFRLAKPAPGAILSTGVWAHVRHPNYLGEVLFWWGLFGFGLAAGGTAAWWTGAGALAITLLFNFASLGLIDTRMLASRPDYKQRMESVPALIPRPWRTRSSERS